MNIYYLILLILFVLILVDKYSTEGYSTKITKNIRKEHFSSDEFNVLLIHMEKNKDRLNNFNSYYNNSDIRFKKYDVFPAVVGKDINLIDYVSPKGYAQILMTEKTRSRVYHYDLTRGAVGCYLSHLAIYKNLINSNLNYSIIFEDDSIMTADFYEKLLFGLSVIPNDWDILLLGVICIKCDTEEHYIKIHRFWGLHGYLVSRNGAKKLLEYLDKPISKQLDADISLLIKRGLIKVYAINPNIVHQDPRFGSDIQEHVINSEKAFDEEFNQNQLNKYN